jgi:hypothetical protein
MVIKIEIPIINKLFACTDCKYYSKNKYNKGYCVLKKSLTNKVALDCEPKKSWRKKDTNPHD